MILGPDTQTLKSPKLHAVLGQSSSSSTHYGDVELLTWMGTFMLVTGKVN
ncbi:hypothetical protein LguiA_003462 [Lonicera macranthoides]